MSSEMISKRFFNKKQSKPTESDDRMDLAATPTTLENPYLSARRSWNDHVGGVMSSRQTWQVMGILCLMIALASVGGMIHIGSQSKFIPYIIEVDKLGQSLAISPAQLVAIPDQRVVHSAVASFINDTRLVTPDIALQRKAIFRVYAMLSANDPATAKSNQWFNGSEDASPFNRAKKETASIEIHTVIPQTPDTWQVDWVETIYDRQGIVQGVPLRMRALVTVYTIPSTPQTTEEQLRLNPLGIYVRDFSWSKQP